jgi:serine phosphatase RsbU (regulator of sigma subunit)
MTDRFQSELDLASHVQQLLFPKSWPTCTWCCIGVRNRMAKGLGGDYFDFITMPDGCQAVFLGDVTGHGLHASVVMSLLYGFLHRSATGNCDPVQTVQEVNGFLQSFATRSREFDHFFSATLFFGIIDPQSLAMHYVNAGHPAPVIRRGETLVTLPTTAPPVGFFDAPEIGKGSFRFERGDRLLLYTDGIPEAMNRRGELFGMGRLQRALERADLDYLELLDRLFAELHEYEANESPADDCTAIVIDFHGPF